ncbi:MAG TPA: DMT family transporter [Burkholderiales bacterium]|nr:DMT family transporter [Burkholderiales bacterium]
MNSRSTANVLADALSRPDAGLAFAALFWSGNFVAGRALADQIDPVSLNFWRWALALAVLLPVSWRALAASRAALRTSWSRIALLGLTGVAAFHTCVYFALAATTATSALLLLSLAPVFIVLATWLAHGEAPSAGELAGIVVSLAGAGVLVTKGSLDALLALRLDTGALWMLVALLIWAAYSVLLRRRIPGVPPLALHTATVIAGLAWMLPAYGTRVAVGETTALTWTGALGIGYIAVFASAIAFFLWIRGVGRLGPNRAGMFIHLMPVFGAILAALFLGERIAMFHVAGAALVFAGLALGNRR